MKWRVGWNYSEFPNHPLVKKQKQLEEQRELVEYHGVYIEFLCIYGDFLW